MSYRALFMSFALLVGGCSIRDSRIATEAQQKLVGMSEPDLEACVGAPDNHSTFGHTDILTYNGNATSNGGIDLTLPIVGGINFAGGGYCHATFRVEDGRVTELRYTGDADATFGHNAYCAPIIRSCVQQPETAAK
jgi:hypothetical protein